MAAQKPKIIWTFIFIRICDKDRAATTERGGKTSKKALLPKLSPNHQQCQHPFMTVIMINESNAAADKRRLLEYLRPRAFINKRMAYQG